MKKKKTTHKSLKIVMIIMLVSIITTISYALYKVQIDGDIQATGATVILDAEKITQESKALFSNEHSEYKFKVKNYITEESVDTINEVVVNYYIKISGLEAYENEATMKLYYVNENGENVELEKVTIGKFKGYYKSTKTMGVKTKEEDNYIISVDVIGIIKETVDVTLNVDLGYKQYLLSDEAVPNAPELTDGMIPVVWNDTTKTWETISSTNPEWYNYEQQKWANIVTVKEENKSKYISAAEGTTVANSDITSMYVWIPRFVYRINSDYYHQKLTTSQAEEIEETGEDLVYIQFSQPQSEGGDYWNTTITVNNNTDADSSNGKWTTCPAFTFGDTELNGIWVMKFEASNSGTSSTTIEDIYSVPAVASINTVTLDNVFAAVRNMETKTIYGMKTASGLQADATFETDNNGYDTHLIKNSEWSAILMLTQSKYGIGAGKIEDNHYYIAGGNNNAVVVYTTNVGQTTTGNVYGIYDMACGLWETMAAYIGDGKTAKSKAPQLYNSDSRYKDVYYDGVTDISTKVNVFNMFKNYKGATIWEIATTGDTTYDAWFDGRSNVPSGTGVFITRGSSGDDSATSVNTSAFSFGYSDGTGSNSRGFRVTMAVNENL